MKIGTPVIINDFDRPCTRLVAIVTDVKEGIVTATYLSKDIANTKCSAPIDEVTPLHVFGRRLDIGEKSALAWAWTSDIGQSYATYNNGTRRLWQEELPHGEGVEIRPEVAKLINV